MSTSRKRPLTREESFEKQLGEDGINDGHRDAVKHLPSREDLSRQSLAYQERYTFSYNRFTNKGLSQTLRGLNDEKTNPTYRFSKYKIPLPSTVMYTFVDYSATEREIKEGCTAGMKGDLIPLDLDHQSNFYQNTFLLACPRGQNDHQLTQNVQTGGSHSFSNPPSLMMLAPDLMQYPFYTTETVNPPQETHCVAPMIASPTCFNHVMPVQDLIQYHLVNTIPNKNSLPDMNFPTTMRGLELYLDQLISTQNVIHPLPTYTTENGNPTQEPNPAATTPGAMQRLNLFAVNRPNIKEVEQFQTIPGIEMDSERGIREGCLDRLQGIMRADLNDQSAEYLEGYHFSNRRFKKN